MKLIILPGWQHTSIEWAQVSKQLNSLKVEHEIFDLPGFSDNNEAVYTYQDILNDVEKRLAKESSDYVLCGHSYGGRIAVKILSEGIKPTKLILIGSPNLYRPTLKTKVLKAISAILGPIKKLMPNKLRKAFRSDDFNNIRGSKLESLFKEVVTDDQTKLLPAIETPTHLVWGELDDAAPLRIAEEIVTLMPSANLQVLSGLGHNIHIEKPELLAATLAKICQN